MADTTTQGQTAPEHDDLDDLATIDFEAEMTQEQVKEYETGQNEVWGMKRRITLISLTRTKAELVAGFSDTENGVEMLMEMIDHVHEWRDHLKASLGLAEAASSRLIVTCAAAMKHQEAAA